MALILTQKKQERDPLDYLLAGLSVASQVYGIKANMAQLDDHKAKMQKSENQSKGVFDKADQLEITKAGLDITPYEAGSPVPKGAFTGTDKDSGSPLLVSIRAKAPEKLIKEVPMMKGNVRGIAVMDYGGPQPKELSFTPDVQKQSVVLSRSSQPSAVQGITGQDGEEIPDVKSLSQGDKERDREFAKKYSEFADQGGFAELSKDLAELEEISEKLGTGSYTGPLQGRFPDVVRKFSNEEAINIREGVRRVAQKNLRLVFGANPTEKEGENFLKRAFDEGVSEEENKARVNSLVDRMRGRGEQLVAAGKYFEKYGTLKGFGSADEIGKLIAKKDPPPETNKGGDGTALGAENKDQFKIGSKVMKDKKTWVKHKDGLWYEE